MEKFQVGDIIEYNGMKDILFKVTSLYSYDKNKLLVTDPAGWYNDGEEFQIWTDEVTNHWEFVRPRKGIKDTLKKLLRR